MKEMKKLYEELEAYSDFDEDYDNTERFLEKADEIIDRKDPESIQVLLSYFDDRSDYDWVFTSLRSSMERYTPYDFVINIFGNIECMLKKAPEFFLDFFLSILNTSEHKEILMNNLSTFNKDAMSSLIELAQMHYPHRKSELDTLRTALLRV